MSAQSPEEVHALLEAAFNTGDIDAFLQLYEEGATHIVPPNGERVSGRDALRTALEPTFALEPSAQAGRRELADRPRRPDDPS